MSVIELATGESVDTDNVDEMVVAWARADAVYKKCESARLVLATALGKLTPDTESRTRRCEGTVHRAILEMPKEGYDTKTLIHLWLTTPIGIRDRVLRIERVGIQLREFKKLEASKCPPELELLVTKIQAAATGPAGNPRIKSLEKVDETEAAIPARSDEGHAQAAS
jgi:hypothetical protein